MTWIDQLRMTAGLVHENAGPFAFPVRFCNADGQSVQLSRLLADILAEVACDEFVVGQARASLQALIAQCAAIQLRPRGHGGGALNIPLG